MDIQRTVWRASTRSTGGGNNCVQVADLNTTIGIRDSKNPEGDVIALPRTAWRQLAARVKAGELDL